MNERTWDFRHQVFVVGVVLLGSNPTVTLCGFCTNVERTENPENNWVPLSRHTCGQNLLFRFWDNHGLRPNLSSKSGLR